MLFETDDGSATAFRHNDGAVFAFTDGHVNWFSPQDAPSVTVAKN